MLCRDLEEMLLDFQELIMKSGWDERKCSVEDMKIYFQLLYSA